MITVNIRKDIPTGISNSDFFGANIAHSQSKYGWSDAASGAAYQLSFFSAGSTFSYYQNGDPRSGFLPNIATTFTWQAINDGPIYASSSDPVSIDSFFYASGFRLAWGYAATNYVLDALADTDNLRSYHSGDFLTGDGDANELTAKHNDVTMIGLGGADTFLIDAGVTSVAKIAGGVADGFTTDAAIDTLKFDNAFTGTIGAISNIDKIEINAAVTATFAAGSSFISTLGVVVNVASATLKVEQAAAAGSTITLDWAVTGTGVLDVTVNTNSGAFGDNVALVKSAGLRNVVINTFDGADTIEAAGGQNVSINGGAGTDALIVDKSAAVTAITFDIASPNWSVFGYASVIGIEAIGITTGSGADSVTGGDYYDTLDGGAGNDTLNAGNGALNFLYGGAGNDSLIGGDGGDYIFGDDDNDSIDGGGGWDVVRGGTGVDTIYGGTGNDDISGGTGADSLDGGDGNDMLSYGYDGSASFGVIVNLAGTLLDTTSAFPADIGEDGLAALIAIAGSNSFSLAAGKALGGDGLLDSFVNFESAQGANKDDFLIGTSGGNTLDGVGGNDWLYGEGGGDRIYGGSGNDQINGGTGDDTMDAGGDTDTAIFSGNWSDYEVFYGTYYTLVGPDGTDVAIDFEFFKFDNATGAASALLNVATDAGDDVSAVITEDGAVNPVTGNVLTNDTDANEVFGDTKTVDGLRLGDVLGGDTGTAFTGSKSLKGTYGTLTIHADGSYSYALDNDDPDTQALQTGDAVTDVFTYRLRDTHGLTDLAQLTIQIGGASDAPIISSNGGGTTATVSLKENISAVATVHATDADGGTIVYSISGGADAARFNINSVTGALTFRTAADFDAPLDANHNNSYVVTVRAGNSLSDTQTITVVIGNLKGNTIAGTTANNTIDLTHKIGLKGATSEEDKIDGKAGNDTINGLAGNDTLIGGLGKDVLTGGVGNDKFVFNAKLNATTNVDTIKDFKHDLDLIQLDDAIFKKIGAKLDAGEFYAKAGAISGHDANDRIIYDKATGKLYFDDDGSGSHAAIWFATLSTKPQSLDHGDFVIV